MCCLQHPYAYPSAWPLLPMVLGLPMLAPTVPPQGCEYGEKQGRTQHHPS